MALPSTNRKTAFESSMVRRRDREHSARQKWDDNAKYFHDSSVQANKFDSWATNRSGNQNYGDSMDTFRKHHELEMKQMQIQRRRTELAKLLKDENLEYETQLRSMSRDELTNLVKMREQVDSFRSAKESERQKVADEKLYEHWRLNNPAIRKAEAENLRQYVSNQWEEQVTDRRFQKASERVENAEWDRRMEALARDESARAASEQSARRQQEAEYREALRQQAIEATQRETENQIIAVEERTIMEELAKLEKIQQDRKEADMRRQKEEHGKVLKKQHAARLLRLSRQIQAELEADKVLLAELVAKQATDDGRSSERRDVARADAAWMQKTIEEQLRLEKQREAELEQLYADEAEREWQRREAEWNKERQARQRLMQEVLKEREQQLHEKYEQLRERQHEIAERRAEVEMELAEIDGNTARERLVAQRDKDARRVALEEQIAQQRVAVVSTAVAEKLDAAQDEQLAEEMDDLVRIETARLRSRVAPGNQPFEPVIQGKRVTWR